MRLLFSFYRYVISPLWGNGMGCRYMPSCSEYAEEAVRKHGILKGGYFAAKRILHCHPLGGHGYDPVPENKTKAEEKSI